jgi:hypothetical protein
MTFFGIPSNGTFNPFYPLEPSNDPPNSIKDYFLDGDLLPIIGGHYADNTTLQYEPELSPFALQLGVQVLSNYTAFLDPESGVDGIAATVQQLPYVKDALLRVDLLVLPLCLAFDFTGMAFSLFDVLLLKGDNIISLFRVAGISEWMTYLGVVVMYKCTTTFLPFFVLLIILGLPLQLVLFGNGGRWLGTIIVMIM